MTDPVVVYLRSDRQYVLITDAQLEQTKLLVDLALFWHRLMRKKQYHVKKQYHAIAYGSRQLCDHELNYSPYLAKMAVTNWVKEYFDNYLRGKMFTLFTEH